MVFDSIGEDRTTHTTELEFEDNLRIRVSSGFCKQPCDQGERATSLHHSNHTRGVSQRSEQRSTTQVTWLSRPRRSGR